MNTPPCSTARALGYGPAPWHDWPEPTKPGRHWQPPPVQAAFGSQSADVETCLASGAGRVAVRQRHARVRAGQPEVPYVRRARCCVTHEGASAAKTVPPTCVPGKEMPLKDAEYVVVPIEQ